MVVELLLRVIAYSTIAFVACTTKVSSSYHGGSNIVLYPIEKRFKIGLSFCFGKLTTIIFVCEGYGCTHSSRVLQLQLSEDSFSHDYYSYR